MNSAKIIPKKNGEDEKKDDAYFRTLSSRFKTAKYVTVVILILFLLTMISVFRNDITVENLRYLFKDLASGENNSYTVGSTVYYDSDSQVSLALYKGDLCVAGSESFILTDLQGNRLHSEDALFSNPVVLSGDKYLLLYGLSENDFYIYNTFSKLFEMHFDHPITGAALSDNGYFAVVTGSSDNVSEINVYDPDFKLIKKITKAQKYVMNVALSNDGSELFIASLYTENGGYCTEYMTVDLLSQSNSPKAKNDVLNVMPLYCGFYPDGNYIAFSDRNVALLDENMYVLKLYDLGGKTPLFASAFGDCAAVCCRNSIIGSETQFIVFDEKGNVFIDTILSDAVKKGFREGDHLYLLLEKNVCRLSLKTGDAEYIGIESNSADILNGKNGRILVGYSNHTSVIDFDGETEN